MAVSIIDWMQEINQSAADKQSGKFDSAMGREVKCASFKFTPDNIDSFQNWNRLILLMPVKLSTAFYSIKMHFNCPIGVGGGRLGVFMMNENEQTETIEAGLFMSGRGEINQDSCPVTLDDGPTGDRITLLPGRYAGKYGTTKVTPVYAGQTVGDLLTQNKGKEYVDVLSKKIGEDGIGADFLSIDNLKRIITQYPLMYSGIWNMPFIPANADLCQPRCRLYLGYLSDHGFCLDVTDGGFEAKYTEN